MDGLSRSIAAQILRSMVTESEWEQMVHEVLRSMVLACDAKHSYWGA